MEAFKTEKYRITLIKDGRLKYFAITWNREKDAEMGDCFIRAISEKTKTKKGEIGIEVHSEPIGLDEIKMFVENQMHWLGFDVVRCLGISLEDEKDKKVYFRKPILMNK